MKVSAIILAGGMGTRFDSYVPKAFLSLNGKPVIQWSIDVIEPLVDEVIVVSENPYRDYKHVSPGQTRSMSAYAGVLAASSEKVIIHDAVRPFITTNQVQAVINHLGQGALSVDTAVPVVDGLLIDELPASKAGFSLGQTPEGFDRKTLLDAFVAATRRSTGTISYDDEVSMVYYMLDINPVVVPGTSLNTKLTYEKDLENAEGIMRYWCEPLTEPPAYVGLALVLGGSGAIGGAVRELVGGMEYGQVVYSPTHSDLDLAEGFDLDLAEDFDLDLFPYAAIVHAAGVTEGPIMGVNFESFVQFAQLAMDQNWTGNIVALSSTAATYGRPGLALYCASKSALNAWIEASHDEYAAKGIYINAIAPAKVRGQLQRRINPGADQNEMLSPDYVARRILPYLNTTVHGHIVFLRYGIGGQ